MADVRELLLQITGDSRDAEQALNKIARKVIQQNRIQGKPQVKLDGIAAAQGKLIELEAQLEALGRQKVSPEVQVDVDRALTRVGLLRAKLTELVRTPTANRDAGVASALLADVAREAGNIGQVMSRATGPTNALNAQFQGMIGAVKQVNPIIQGLGLIIFTILIPAFIALGSSLAGAIAGLGALAVAFAAALGPAVVGLIAIISRVSAVLAVRQQRQAALNAQTRKSATADAEAAAQAERVRNAQNSVRDALESRTAAQRAFNQAQRDAADAIEQARQAAADAAATVRDETVAAYRAMQDSAEAARDAVLALQDAQLGLEESRLSIRKAAKELADFRKGISATGPAFDGLFKRFTDVNFDPKKLRSALKAAVPQGTTDDQQIQLEQLILNLRRAKLGEKQATDRLKDSTVELSRARQDDVAFQRDGIRAFQPYVNALRQQRDANKKLAEVQRQGIANNPQVVAARDALRDASQRVTEAEHDLRVAKKKTDDTLASTGPQALYEKALGRLSGAEKELLDAILKIGPGLKEFARSISDPVLGAAADVINGLKGKFGLAAGLFAGLGQTFADNLRALFADFSNDPRWFTSMLVFADAAQRVSKILGGSVFRDFFAILRNVAVAAMPFLIKGFESLARGLKGLRAGTDDTKSLGDTIGLLVKSTGAWFRVLGAAAGAIMGLAKTAGPAGDSILGGITGAFDQLTGFLNSPKGKKAVKDFFKDALPAIKSLLAFLVKLGIAFLQLFRFFAPAIKFVIDGFSLVLDVLNFVLGLLNKIPAPIRALLGVFFPFGTVIKAAFAPLKLVRPALEALAPFFGRFVGALRAAFGPVAAIVRAAFRPIAGIFRATFGVAVALGRGYLNGLIGFLRGYVGVVRTVLGAVWSVFKRGFEPIAGLVKSIVGAIVKAIRGIAGATESVFGKVLGVFRAVFNVIADLLNVFIDGLNKLIGLVNKIPNIKTPFGSIGIPDLPLLPHVPKLAAGGIATSSVLANIGEAGREAVIPLRHSVLAALGRSIVSAMSPGFSSGRIRPLAAGGGTGGMMVNVTLPPAPAAAIPDARYQAVQLARELARRGGGTS